MKIFWLCSKTKFLSSVPYSNLSKSRLLQMVSSVERNRMFSERILSTRSIFNATSKPFGSQGCSDDKNWLNFSSIFFEICRFRSYFLLRCKFSFHEKQFESSLTEVWFFWTNQNSLLRIAINAIASFCIDNRLCQMAFSCSQKWAKAGFRVKMRDFEIKKLYIAINDASLSFKMCK